MNEPLECIALKCCGNRVFIPIRKERKYIDYVSEKYKLTCKNCDTTYPEWRWSSSVSEVKHIKAW